MVETAGTKLRRARTLRQLSIEDAARETKIRPRQIADLERDDYSNFANLAYARGFFVSYAKFLHVNVQPYLEAFADANTFGLDDYQYLSEAPLGVYRAPSRPLRRRRRKRKFMAAGTTLAVLAATLTLWYFVISYRRLGPLDKLAARQQAQQRAAREGNPAVAADSPAAGAEAAGATHDKAPAAVLPSVETIPVSAPVSSSPAPSPVPANDRTLTTAAALAAAENATTVPVGPLALPPAGGATVPAVPLPGDGAAARALTQGPDLHATLAGAPAGLNDRDPAGNAQAKVRAAKPSLDPTRRPDDSYRANAPQTVSNNTVH